MKIFQPKKHNKILIFTLMAAMFSQIFSPIQSTSAASAEFNHIPGDHELLTGTSDLNATTNFYNPVLGTAGQTFKGVIYYHNATMSDTAALNTNIKLHLPSISTNREISMWAEIDASNAIGPINSTDIGGVPGRKYLITTLSDADARVELVSGTVEWYPENRALDLPKTNFPNNQSGDEIIGAAGLNIGNIDSCWNHQGRITFQYRTIKLQSDLRVDKTVQNISRGETAWNSTTTARPGELVGFKIAIKNNGNLAINGLDILDSLPGDLEFYNTDPPIIKSIDGGVTYTPITDSGIVSRFFGTGTPIGVLAENQEIIYKFKVKVPAFVAREQFAYNTAIVFNSTMNVRATAEVKLQPDLLPPTIVKSKIAKNLNTTIEGKELTAKPDDVVLYTLTTKNTGGSPINMVIEDGVSDILDYADITDISDGGLVVNGTVGNEEKLVRYPAITIVAGETVVRTIKIKVHSVLTNTPELGFRFDYKMYNKYGDDVVNITLPRPITAKPVLKVEKTVRNVTQSETAFAKSNFAKPGDTLEYKISFFNTGTSSAPYLKVTDILPSNVVFQNSTTVYSFNGEPEKTLSDGVTTSQGVSFNSLQANEFGYVKFKVTASATLANNENLVNTAYASSLDLSSSDTATTIIRKTTTPVVPVTPNSPLPQTGPSTAVISLLSALLMAVVVMFMQYKKVLSNLEKSRIYS